MIRLLVWLRADGCLESFRAAGHSDLGGKGADTVCAAVTVLLRTAGRLLESDALLGAEGEAPEPGAMRLRLPEPPDDRRERVRGVTDFLVRGLRDLQAEFPDRVELSIRQKGRVLYGT